MDDQASRPARDLDVNFSGQTGEYFRIWIVNIALTVLTLGIYSAWAKVRTLRYFYSHTSIEGAHFDYHATPQAILIGRLIAAALVAAYYFGSQYVPAVALSIIVIVVLAVPWLMVRSRSFQMRNTSFNGIRFDFRRNYVDSFKVIYGGVAFTIITLGLGAPSAIYWRNRFVANNSGYGRTAFEFRGRAGAFYAIFWKSVGLAIAGVLVTMAVLIPVTGALTGVSNEPGMMAEIVSTLVVLPIFFVYMAIGVYVQVRQRNYVWNSTFLGDNGFSSSLSVRTMVWIYASNILAIIFSLGLMIPWAKIRLARYRAEHMTVLMTDELDAFMTANTRDNSAIGDEVGEAFDMEVEVAF